MSTTPSQDPQHPEPREDDEPGGTGTQDAPLDRAEPEAPYDLADAGAEPPAAEPEAEPAGDAAEPAGDAAEPAGDAAEPEPVPPSADPAAGEPARSDVPASDATADDSPPLGPDDTGTSGSPYDVPRGSVTTSLPAGPGTGQHRVERPVPRSGLAEQHSAGYLTGERAAPAEDASGPDGPTGATTPEPPVRRSWTAMPAGARPADDGGPDTAVVLDGASVEPQVRSRAKAHWLGVLVTIVLLPVAWYLLADAGARLTLPTGSPWQSGNLNIAAVLELAGGLAVLAVVLLAARWSSVGSIVAGSLVLVLGVPFVAVPQWTQELLAPALQWLRDLNDLGGNVAHHLVATGSTGRFVVYGLALVLLGVVSHGARRQGRREAIARARLDRG